MSKHEPKYILIDMLDAINAMLEFTSGKTYNQFMNDRMLRDAVLFPFLDLKSENNGSKTAILPTANWFCQLLSKN